VITEVLPLLRPNERAIRTVLRSRSSAILCRMPHTTASFGFEFKIFTWAQALVQQMSRRQGAGFVLAFELEGIVRLTIVPVHLGTWQELRGNGHPSETYILYDPFLVPEYAYVQWRSIERPLMESVIGVKFDSADFVAKGYGIGHADAADQQYPVTWGVMF
jgi:hypothetical protein